MNQSIEQVLEENRQLTATINELSILNDIATAISSSQTLEKIESQIIKLLVKQLRAEEGLVMLLNEEDLERPFQTMLRKKNTLIDSLPHKLNDQLLGFMMHNKSPLIINDFRNDSGFNIDKDINSPIKSLVCAPILFKGNLIGLVCLFNKLYDELFTEEDKRLLAICSAQSGQIIENARLTEKELLLKKYQDEMSIAEQIQKNILPSRQPTINNYLVYGKSIASNEVGGDFYDFVQLSEKASAIYLGDISGKGIPAALLMSNLAGMLRTESLNHKKTITVVSNSNKSLYNNIESDKYSSLFYSILNSETNSFQFCSAGHESAFLFKEDKFERLFTEGIVIGIMDEAEFEEKEIFIEKGDIIIIYSDGFSEAENRDELQFGEEKLLSLVTENRHLDPDELFVLIKKEVDNFSEGMEQIDDQTMVVIKRIV